MMNGVSLRKQLHAILEEKMLPAARNGAPLILLEPPIFAAPHEHLNVVSTSAKPLPRAKMHRSHLSLYYWPEHVLNALRIPYLACVFEGEADICTALTLEQAKKHDTQRGPKGELPFGRQTISIRDPGFFIVPPGTPVSTGSRPHWERPDPQSAHSRIFWIHFVPSGVFCHTCASSKGRHRTHPFIFVADHQLTLLSGLLLSEISRGEMQQGELVRSLLLSLLLKISQAFAREKSVLLHSEEAMESAAALRPGAVIKATRGQAEPQDVSVVVRRAMQFLEANVNEPMLNPAMIAAHSLVSVSHLNRLFKAELSTPVMEYVTRIRLDKARALLVDTDLPISEISGICGYANRSHFAQLFSRHETCSPRAFRNQHRKNRQRTKNIASPW